MRFRLAPAGWCALAAYLLYISFIVLSYLPASAQTPTPQAAQEPTEGSSATNSDFDASEVPVPNAAPSALLGESLYLENCAPCHGQTGDSDGPVVENLPNPPPQFSNPATVDLKSPAEYFYVTKFGRIENLMPPWGNRLRDEEIWHAAAYAWSLHTDQEAVAAGLAILEEAALDDPAIQPAIESGFASPDSLFMTQQEMLGEFRLAAPELAASLSPLALASVTDYLRTLTIIPPWGATYRAGNATIEGQVVPGFADEPLSGSVEGLPVALKAFIQLEQVATFETVTDADGFFRFENLSHLPTVLYLVDTTYLNVPYSSGVVDLVRMSNEGTTDSTDIGNDDGMLVSIELPVYETTTNIDELIYNRVNWVVDYVPGELIIGQILSIGNQGNQTIIGRKIDGIEEPVILELSVPSGANTLQFQDGELGGRFRQVEDSVFDTVPITPGDGTHQVFMSYRLPIEGNAAQLTQAFLYPMQALNLLVAEIPDLTANISDLTFIGAENVQNIPYLYWQGQGLEPRSFTLELDGLIAEGEADPRGDLGLGAATGAGGGADTAADSGGTAAPPLAPELIAPTVPLIVGGLVLALLAGLVILPRTGLTNGGSDIRHANRLQEDKARLLNTIAYLDDRHAAGALSDTAWQKERTRLKRQLIAVALQIQGA